MPIDVAGAMVKIRAAEARALEDLGAIIAKDAKQRAPVRKLEKQGRRRRRIVSLNSPEGRAMVRAYSRIGNPTDLAAVAFKNRGLPVKINRKGTHNSPLRLGNMANVKTSDYKRQLLGKPTIFRARRTLGAKAQTRTVHHRVQHGFELNEASMEGLSARGRYEVRSGRAVQLSPIGTKAGGGFVEVGLRVEIGGALRKSINSSGAVAHDHGMKVDIAADVPYARYVEFPTSHNAAQPFLLPALKGAKRIVKRTFEGALKEQGFK